MAKRIQDPSRRLGAKAAAHWRNLENLDRVYLASRAKENPAVSVPAHTTAGQTPKSQLRTPKVYPTTPAPHDDQPQATRGGDL